MPADAEPTLRPEIAHILSLDVVGYSKLPVNQQVDLLKRPRLNFVVQHLLVTKEALIGCFVAMSFPRSIV
jgi:hypothetical protein